MEKRFNKADLVKRVVDKLKDTKIVINPSIIINPNIGLASKLEIKNVNEIELNLSAIIGIIII